MTLILQIAAGIVLGAVIVQNQRAILGWLKRLTAGVVRLAYAGALLAAILVVLYAIAPAVHTSYTAILAVLGSPTAYTTYRSIGLVVFGALAVAAFGILLAAYPLAFYKWCRAKWQARPKHIA